MPTIRGSISATVLTIAVSGCVGGSPTIGSTVSAGSPPPTAPTATRSTLEQAFDETTWVAQDPTSGGWIVGRGPHATTHLDLGKGRAEANASATAYIRRADGRAWAGIVGADGHQTDWPLGFDGPSLTALSTPRGDVVLVHAGEAGRDDGVVMFDAATGRSAIVVAPADGIDGRERSLLLMSSSGSTALSTFCSIRDCLVDVIDVAAKTARRLDAAFPAVGLTDRYVLGHVDDGGAWLALDLDSGRISELSLDRKTVVTAIVAASDTAFVLDVQAEDGDRVIRLDLATDTSRVLYDGAHASTPGLQLMREPVLGGRWVLLAKGRSMSGLLAEVDGPPTMVALDIDSGAISPDQLVRTP